MLSSPKVLFAKITAVDKKILVISEGPPPLGSTGAEGGALRAWGISKGLAGHGFTVTFAYRSTFALADDANIKLAPKNVSIETWDGTNLQEVIERHQVVVMRYAMGEAPHVLAFLKEDQILVSDSYIPISVEVAARRSAHPDEVTNYLRLQKSSLLATRRADYILYASSAQHDYYIGYLAGINKLNPATYDDLQQRMFMIPYGVDPSDKPARLQPFPEKPTLLWYGAFYSWFDMEGLVESLKEVRKNVPGFRMVIAGAKNPYNKDPALLAHYERTMRSLEPLRDIIELVPWGPYDERFATYAKGSAIITWNHEGLENRFAWRTRLMDFILAERPVITNGGDPLGEDLIRRGIAYRANLDTIAAVFKQAIDNPPSTAAYDSAANDYSWHELTSALADTLREASRMKKADMELKGEIVRAITHRIRWTVTLPYLVVKSIKKNGINGTVQKMKSKLIKWV